MQSGINIINIFQIHCDDAMHVYWASSQHLPPVNIGDLGQT